MRWFAVDITVGAWQLGGGMVGPGWGAVDLGGDQRSKFDG